MSSHVLKWENGQLIRTPSAEKVGLGPWVLTFTIGISIPQPAKLSSLGLWRDLTKGWGSTRRLSPISSRQIYRAPSAWASGFFPDLISYQPSFHFWFSSHSDLSVSWATQAPSSLRAFAWAESQHGSLFPLISEGQTPCEHLAPNSNVTSQRPSQWTPSHETTAHWNIVLFTAFLRHLSHSSVCVFILCLLLLECSQVKGKDAVCHGHHHIPCAWHSHRSSEMITVMNWKFVCPQISYVEILIPNVNSI